MVTSEGADEAREERQEDTKETGRLEAFSDGVFAIAITLLVLNLPVSQPFPTGNAAWVYLFKLWPQYLAYVLSFVTILIMWANHHLIFRLIRRTNQFFLMLNGLLLMCITFLNFPTGLLGTSLSHGDPAVAALIYNGTFVVIAVLFNILWRYAAHNGRLLDTHADPAMVQTIHRQYRFGPLFYLVAFVAAFFSAGLSIGIDLALAVYFAFSGTTYTLRKREDGREPAETPAIPR